MKLLHRFITFLILSMLLISCGADEVEEIELAIDEANFFLTYNKCDKALEVLNAVGDQPYNAMYLMVKASAYACKAHYSDITFFGSDIAKVASGQNDILGSFTKFSSSTMTESDDTKYNHLQTAIDTLLFAGSITRVSHANRAAVFPVLDIQEMNTQMLWMIMVQFGKYLYYYGNANPVDGKKGGGAAGNGNTNGNTNVCMRTYTSGAAQAIVDAATTTPCTNPYAGHPDLDGTGAAAVSRMCEGVVMFNNMVDILINTTLATTGETSSVGGIGSTINTFFDTVCGAAVPTAICGVKTQSQCESLYASDTDTLELFFSAVFETMFLGDP